MNDAFCTGGVLTICGSAQGSSDSSFASRANVKALLLSSGVQLGQRSSAAINKMQQQLYFLIVEYSYFVSLYKLDRFRSMLRVEREKLMSRVMGLGSLSHLTFLRSFLKEFVKKKKKNLHH